MIGTPTGFRVRMLALTGFVAVTALVFFVLFNLAGGVDVGKRYRVDVVVPTALQLSENADVRSAGVRIGSVERISNRGATAVLALALDPDHEPLHRDARVQVRAKTLVGENYVDVEPGAGGAIADGGELPMTRAKPATQLDDILATFSPQRRARLRRLLSGVGPGLGDSRSVGRGVSGIADLLDGGKRVAPVLDEERDALRALVADLGVVFRAVGERRDLIAQLVGAARRSATLVAAEERALRSGLRELPGTLTQVRATTGRLARVGHRTGPVLDDLTRALNDLRPAVDELPR
ncbi:MAG TPA: MlaD family protein, partial [Solirubrobacteraceae bacterium]